MCLYVYAFKLSDIVIYICDATLIKNTHTEFKVTGRAERHQSSESVRPPFRPSSEKPISCLFTGRAIYTLSEQEPYLFTHLSNSSKRSKSYTNRSISLPLLVEYRTHRTILVIPREEKTEETSPSLPSPCFQAA